MFFTQNGDLFFIEGFKYQWYFDMVDGWVYQEVREGGYFADLKPVFKAADADEAINGVEARDNSQTWLPKTMK